MKIKSFSSTTLRVLAMGAVMLAHHSYPQPASHRIEIVAKRFTFSPADITVKKGEPVVLAVTSQDVDHGLKFKDLNLSVAVKKGHTGEISFTPDHTGTFVGQCSVFCGSGHGGMTLTLHVTE